MLETVALRRDRPDLGLSAGCVGVVVVEWQPGIFEVEFADLEGKTYARAALPEGELLALRHGLSAAA